MPRGGPPTWRARNKDWDHLIAASINAGHAKLVYSVDSDERALEVQRGLFRSAKAAGISVSVKQVKPGDGTVQLHYKTHSKEEARAYVVSKYGADPNAWPYHPRRKNPKVT